MIAPPSINHDVRADTGAVIDGSSRSRKTKTKIVPTCPVTGQPARYSYAHGCFVDSYGDPLSDSEPDPDGNEPAFALATNPEPAGAKSMVLQTREEA